MSLAGKRIDLDGLDPRLVSLLSKVVHLWEVGADFDAGEYYDDDEEEGFEAYCKEIGLDEDEAEEETEEQDVLEGQFGFERLEVQGKQEHAVQEVTCDRTNIARVAASIEVTPGVTKVVAQPGSGKTSVLPAMINSGNGLTVCVVPNNTVLANVGCKMKDVTLLGDVVVSGNVNLQYMTRECYVASELNVMKGATLVVDEAQETNDLMDRVAMKALDFSSVGRLVLAYGNFANGDCRIPDNVGLRDRDKYIESEHVHDRVLVVHPDLQSLYNALGNGQFGLKNFALLGKLLKDMPTLNALTKRRSYKLHALYPQTVGLDLDLDVVVAPDYIVENNLRRSLVRNEHWQLALRLGRRGNPGVYYGCVDFARIPTIVPNLSTKRKPGGRSVNSTGFVKGKPKVREKRFTPEKIREEQRKVVNEQSSGGRVNFWGVLDETKPDKLRIVFDGLRSFEERKIIITSDCESDLLSFPKGEYQFSVIIPRFVEVVEKFVLTSGDFERWFFSYYLCLYNIVVRENYRKKYAMTRVHDYDYGELYEAEELLRRYGGLFANTCTGKFERVKEYDLRGLVPVKCDVLVL